MYNTDTQLLYLAVLLAKPDLYTKMKAVHKPKFYNATIKKAAEYIDEYYEQFSSLPDHLLIKTKTSVDVPKLPEVDFAAEQWFTKEYPKFCLHKSLESAIFQSNEELENENYEVVEKIIQEAYEVRLGFDYGLNYDEDPKGRLQNILERSGNISSTFDTIDRKLGKYNSGDLIVYIGGSGCVTYETPVTVKFENSDNTYIQKIGSLMGVNESHGLYVDSPDGWVKVIDCVKKFKESMYKIFFDNTTIDASHDHLFQRIDGEWIYARDIKLDEQFISKDGISKANYIVPYDEMIDVYDLSVDHENHRYYTDGICSHNTGKSLFLQNHGVNYWKEGKNVLQITLELHPELVARRMDSMLLGLSTKELYSSLDNVAAQIAIEKKRSSTKGEMRVKAMPSGSTTSEIKNLVKMYMNDTGQKVDILIVDYLDLVNPAGSYKIGDTFNKDKLVSEELRNIGQELGPVVITASQLNRCLTLDTAVDIKDKGRIFIKDVAVGDEIKTDEGYNTIKAISDVTKQKVYKITTKSGKTITCSERHVFPSDSGEKSIRTGLSVGSMLMVSESVAHEYEPIASIEEVGEEDTIDIETDGNHLFFANDILTHNSAVGEEDIDHSHIAGGISKINTADLVLAIISTAAMREKGYYELQAVKVRNGQGVGLKFPLLYNSNTMKIFDDPDYLSTINTNMSVQQSNAQLNDNHVSKMVNTLQDALNIDDPNYTPTDSGEDNDDRLDKIRNMIKQQGN